MGLAPKMIIIREYSVRRVSYLSMFTLFLKYVWFSGESGIECGCVKSSPFFVLMSQFIKRERKCLIIHTWRTSAHIIWLHYILFDRISSLAQWQFIDIDIDIRISAFQYNINDWKQFYLHFYNRISWRIIVKSH